MCHHKEIKFCHFETTYMWHCLQSLSQWMSRSMPMAGHPSHFNLLNADHPPKLKAHGLSDYTETKSAQCGLFTLHIFTAFEALPGLFCAPFLTEAGGGRRDSTFVSSTHQSHLLQVHMWGCVLPLEQFTIYQVNRQMSNHFLHLLNLCCFRQPANTTHSTPSREAASKRVIP